VRIVVLGLVAVTALTACDGQNNAIGLRNGTDRVLTVVEVDVSSGRAFDGGKLQPGSEFMFDGNRGVTLGVIEIRDETGAVLSTIDEAHYCPQEPVFVITEEFLEVEAWGVVENCLADGAYPRVP
jgi:hypothetical protein